ncbi:MAG: pentapeptide repeat-containing protein, partial [Flavobacterium sp.]
ANLKMAYFKNSNLKNVNLKNTNLRKTNFLTSNLISSDIIIDENDISLENLIKLEKLSFKTITFCLECGFITLNCINQYINDFGSFIYLTEIGKETEKKLLQIYKKSKNFQIKNLKESSKNKSPLDNLNNLKLDVLKNYFDYSYSKLSIRAQNGLISLIKNKDIIEIIKIINKPNFEFDEIKNIGEKTLKELKKWKLYLINYLDKIYSTSNNVLRIDYFKWLLKNIFPKLPFNFFSELDLYFLDNEKINLFKMLSLIFKSNKILDSKRALIFNNIFINIDKFNNSIIANKLNLSRERVRQLQSSLENELIFKLKPLNRLYQLNYFNYNFELNKSLIVLDNDLMIKINTKEDVNFNLDFITLIYNIFLNETHNPLLLKLNGEKKVVFNKKYLIKKKYFRHFNFEEFFTKIFLLSTKKNNYTYTIKKTDIINEFLNSSVENIIEELDYICSIIVKHEFNIKINNDYFIINRNTKKELYEYVYETLDEKGKMKKIEEIYLEIKKKVPELNFSLESVRSILQRDKERFVYFGRASTYGLKKWEDELDNFKGGTIRKIAIEYLNAYSSPKHISEISNYILKYRSNSSEYSIVQNLKLEENGTFIFFTNGHIGLSNKIYENNYTKITDAPAIEKKEWKDRFVDLEVFYKKHKKLPSSNSGNDVEVKLYRWLSIQKKKLKNGSLNDKNKILLRKFLTEI